MKIAIPVTDERLATHFGHCEKFAFIEADERGAITSETEYVTPPPHEPGVLPGWLHGHGVTHVIAGGMGQRALQLFQANGIQVVVGAPSDDPESSVRAFLSGTLERTENLCDH
ncbi:MAG: NifB/NifX family molybdenum-iron cluster-binding protein [Candidatus Hydrogenedentes bacterium]|nr:NifB/NifX family molybdenum-iron cluster-binding protein [Candidatus Hydrogenedentota bacterium]